MQHGPSATCTICRAKTWLKPSVRWATVSWRLYCCSNLVCVPLTQLSACQHSLLQVCHLTVVKATLVDENSLLRKEVNDKEAELLTTKSDNTAATVKVGLKRERGAMWRV